MNDENMNNEDVKTDELVPEISDEDKHEALYDMLDVNNVDDALEIMKLRKPILFSTIKLIKWFEKTDVKIVCRTTHDQQTINALLSGLYMHVPLLVEKISELSRKVKVTNISEEEAKKLLDEREGELKEEEISGTEHSIETSLGSHDEEVQPGEITITNDRVDFYKHDDCIEPKEDESIPSSVAVPQIQKMLENR